MHKKSEFTSTVLIFAAISYYWILANKQDGSVFEPVSFGLVFNSMALHLWSGRFDVDPAVIGNEAFVHNGQSIAYFGVFPSLIRMPLIPLLDLSSVSLSRLYTFLALSVGSLGQVAAVRFAIKASAPAPAREAISSRMTLAALLSGPPIMLAFSGTVFDESLAWAWALTSIFVALTLREATRQDAFRTPALAAMASVAGLCLLTRPTTALSLHVSLALILSWLLLKGEEGSTPSVRQAWRRARQCRFLVPTMIVIAFLAIAMIVNFGRWGDPFVVADMRAQIHLLARFPDRIARLDQYGLFNPIRFGYGLIYYFFPIWAISVDNTYLLDGRIRELFDAFELPPSSFILSDPLTLTLSAVGLISLVRRRISALPTPPVLCLVGGLSIAPILMLMAWYMAFRYRLEFSPLFLVLACQGAVTWIAGSTQWSAAKLKFVTVLLGLLLIAQIASAHLHAVLYAASRVEVSESVPQNTPVSFYKAALQKLLLGN